MSFWQLCALKKWPLSPVTKNCSECIHMNQKCMSVVMLCQLNDVINDVFISDNRACVSHPEEIAFVFLLTFSFHVSELLAKLLRALPY